jgi:hypothetical protein
VTNRELEYEAKMKAQDTFLEWTQQKFVGQPIPLEALSVMHELFRLAESTMNSIIIEQNDREGRN